MMAAGEIQKGWTDTSQPYPSFLNLMLRDNDMIVTVRAPAREHYAGIQATMQLPRAMFVGMVIELLGEAAARAIADLGAAAAPVPEA